MCGTPGYNNNAIDESNVLYLVLRLTDDAPAVVKKVLAEASAELNFENKEILDTLRKYVDDGTLSGQRSGRIQKMSDDILHSLRKKGEVIED